MKAILLACLALSATMFAPSASADECGGQVVARDPIVRDGVKIGEIQLNYNGEFQRYCAVTRHANATWGVTLPTQVSLDTCTPDDMCYGGRGLIDHAGAQGHVPYVQGPVRTVGGTGRCGVAWGFIWYKAAWHKSRVAGCVW